MTASERREVNEASVKHFFATWDPAWRWQLLLGLRDLRKNAGRLGELASKELGNDDWSNDLHVYGPVALGLTAAGVNELAQYCEDLFALLSFMGDDLDFVERITSYGAGKVTRVAGQLLGGTDDHLRALFLVPSKAAIAAGLEGPDDVAAATALADEGVHRLRDLVVEVGNWYLDYEFFHVQYKHGLKLPLRPFGSIPASTAEARKSSVTAPLIAYTNEPLSRSIARTARPAGDRDP